MIGVFANTVCVVVGSLLGLILRRGIPQNIKKIIMTGLGLFTCMLGIKMGLEMGRALVVVLSLVTGGVLGELFRIEDFLEGIATKLKVVVKARNDTSFAQAFVTASLLFCVGPMTILGSLQAGLENNPELLFVKSLMDGVSAVILCSTIGIGVIFSALVVLLYQGFLVLLAQQLQFLMNPLYLNDFTSVGGMLVFAIGLKLLDVKQIKVANFLPALVLVLLFAFLFR